MRRVLSEIEIHAPPAQVWYVLTNFEEYAEWNPLIRHMVGQARAGAPFEMHLTPPGLGATRSKPRLVDFEDMRELRWQHRFFLPGMFDIDHDMTIAEVDGDRVLFRQEGRFTGVLVPVFGGRVAAMRRGFVHMNDALKERSEALAEH